MPIALFDPFSGASGDMLLGALVDAGAPLTGIQRELDKIGVPVTLRAEPIEHGAVRGTRVTVVADDDTGSRTWRDIRGLIERAALGDSIKARALEIFGRLAAAEAKVHQQALEAVHFHEVGGLDTIADICGVAIALDLLAIDAVYCGPLRFGSGFVRSAHGILPVPAPATAELIASSNAPITTALPPSEQPPGELLTPTGAAILTTIADFSPVTLTPERQGYGFGARELPWPNALRVWLGSSEQSEAPSELVLETNLDDMNPQLTELLLERLFAAGALDVWVTPIAMKKGRPAFTVSALAPANRRGAIEEAFILNSSTLGVRAYRVDRTKADRRFETVSTRWGEVRVKLRGWRGRVIDVMPEYDDCARLARAADIPIRDIWNEAHRLSEVYVGRKWNVTDRDPRR